MPKPVGAAQLDTSNPLSQNLLAAYIFNEASGLTCVNLANSARNANLAGGAQRTTGTQGSAIRLSQSGDHIGIPGLFTSTNNCTIVCGFNGVAANLSGIVFFANPDGSGIGLRYGNNGDLNYDWNNAPGAWNSGLTVPANTDVFTGVVISSTNARLHLNASTATRTINHAALSLTGGFRVGQNSTNNDLYRIIGLINYVYIWNVALTPAQMTSLNADPYQFVQEVPPTPPVVLPTQITRDIQSLSHSAIVELFSLDLSPLGVNQTFRFCNYSNGLTNVLWQGQSYTATPIQATGFEYSGRGQLPTPQLSVANALGAITSLLLQYSDLVGARLTRQRTLVKFLDGQPTADPTQFFPPDVYFIDRKVSESKLGVTFELSSSFDLQGVRLPLRVVTANLCTALYRSAECSYAAQVYFDEFDNYTTDQSLDKCGKRLASCKLRFGQYSQLPFNGYPGVDAQRLQ